MSGRLIGFVAQIGDADVAVETARMIAGAYFGSIEAMMQHWSNTCGTSSVLDAIEPSLPAYARFSL